jgi:hypothetical protein
MMERLVPGKTVVVVVDIQERLAAAMPEVSGRGARPRVSLDRARPVQG